MTNFIALNSIPENSRNLLSHYLKRQNAFWDPDMNGTSWLLLISPSSRQVSSYLLIVLVVFLCAGFGDSIKGSTKLGQKKIRGLQPQVQSARFSILPIIWPPDSFQKAS